VYFELVVARLDESAEGVAALATHLSRSETDRAARLRFERDRRRYTVARGRLRELLASRLDADPGALEFVYGENGKPALADASLHFNVSHCEDLAVYAFSCERELGVDVEALHPIREADGIAAQFFSRVETQAFCALDAASRTLGFYNCWTRKEAIVKAIGDGLAMPLDGFAVSLAPGDAARVLHIAGRPGDGGWSLHSFTPSAGFVAAVAIAPESAPESAPG
jgi:4'-phosphopantetheinyl transferase